MMFLNVAGKGSFPLDKRITLVGRGAGFDVAVGEGESSLLFTIEKEEGQWRLLPADARVWVNGRAVGQAALLEACDRIEWRDGVAAVVDSQPAVGPAETLSHRCLAILQGLAEGLEAGLPEALRKTLAAVVELSGAEAGYLVSEVAEGGGWELLASVGERPDTRALLSHTVLGEAILTRKPVHLESLVGHPWARQASLMSARVFSIACLPLFVSGRCFGCLYLYTRTPGKSIRKSDLGDIGILATQATLLLASRARHHRRIRDAQGTSLFFEARPENPMAALDDRLSKLAGSALNLLVLGETGVGKELVAREIHRRSPRSKGPFVALNCGALPPSLIESVLFGFSKGAFTGADKDVKGKFVEAHGGTLFLDEIGDLPLELQVKLLRVIQEKQVEPLGSGRSVPVDIRVVAATHRDLLTRIREGAFRDDLYYRLAGATLTVPPLRERVMDIAPLARLFLSRAGEDLRLTAEAEARLIAHRWPGNVRELEQVIARAAALCTNGEVTPADLELEAAADGDTLEALSDLKTAQEALTRRLVKQALDRAEGNRGRAAALLGISERTLYRLLATDSAGGEV